MFHSAIVIASGIEFKIFLARKNGATIIALTPGMECTQYTDYTLRKYDTCDNAARTESEEN